MQTAILITLYIIIRILVIIFAGYYNEDLKTIDPWHVLAFFIPGCIELVVLLIAFILLFFYFPYQTGVWLRQRDGATNERATPVDS